MSHINYYFLVYYIECCNTIIILISTVTIVMRMCEHLPMEHAQYKFQIIIIIYYYTR